VNSSCERVASHLGEALRGEPPAPLERLASEDQRQAQEGLVALMRNGKVSYKPLRGALPRGDARQGSCQQVAGDVAQGAARRMAWSRGGFWARLPVVTPTRQAPPTYSDVPGITPELLGQRREVVQHRPEMAGASPYDEEMPHLVEAEHPRHRVRALQTVDQRTCAVG
jgi:hypothetical protein